MRPPTSRRVLTGLTSVIGAAALAMSLLTAAAVAAPDPGPTPSNSFGRLTDGPQTANIPVLAWVGEQVRLVACDPNIGPAFTINYGNETANYRVEEWTGNQSQKPTADGENATNTFGGVFNPESSAFFEPSDLSHAGMGCVQADYKSVKPGLARIKLNVYGKNLETGNVNLVYAKQYLVIWMTANKPTIHEAAETAAGSEIFQNHLSETGKAKLSAFLGDPKGDGIFTPTPFVWNPAHEDKGLIQIRVTGSFPVLDEDMQAYLGTSPTTGSSTKWQLPQDWATLAAKLAESSESKEAVESAGIKALSYNHQAKLWDIHGTPGLSNGEEAIVEPTNETGLVCKSGTPSSEFSATDNCNGSTGNNEPEETAFSRIYGDLTSGETSTEGPFDPLAANQTLLSDGRLNQDDAPMPALQINVGIEEHLEGGLGGVGSLEEIGKETVYSRNFNPSNEAATATEAHNLYNPYYAAYLPATMRPINEASGVDGVEGRGGDFTGFLTDKQESAANHLYEFWNNLETTSSSVASETNCLFRTYGTEPATGEGVHYKTPSGPTGETFYTDERGELYVAYSPGNGFYFDNLSEIKRSANGGCDLQAYLGREIGNSVITADPAYPYQGVSFQPEPSDPLTKVVKSAWQKSLVDFPKSTTAGYETTTRIFVAQAKNIDGLGVAHEIVCFTAQNAGDVRIFQGTVGGIDLKGTSPAPLPPGYGASNVCVYTDGNGNASVEVTNTLEGLVDVHANFFNEGIGRDDKISFSTAPNEEHVGEAPSQPIVKAPTGPTGTPPVDSKAAVTSVMPPSNNSAISTPNTSSSSGPSGTSTPTTTTFVAPKGKKARVSSARLLKHGKHYYLLAKISSSSKTAKIKLVLVSSSGKVLRTITATVTTNKTIRLAVPYSSRVASIRLTVR